MHFVCVRCLRFLEKFSQSYFLRAGKDLMGMFIKCCITRLLKSSKLLFTVLSRIFPRIVKNMGHACMTLK